MNSEPRSNAERVAIALAPFPGTDLVKMFRTEKGVHSVREALDAVAAPDLVTLMIGAEGGLTGTFHGVDGFIEAWHDYTETFEYLRNELSDLVEAGDAVLVETRQIGATATAGVEIDYDAAAIFRFAEGKLQQAEFHLDRQGARRAVGLEPGAGSE
jgi:ketosteroid isomerase-like protein